MKIQRIALLVFSSLFSLSTCSQPTSNQTDDSLEKITFVLDWTPNTNHTGLYVAQEKGYFEDLGLDVEIVQPSEDSASMLVASGKAQFGISAQDSLAANYASEKPLPITTVAAVLQHNTSGIMSRQGEGIDRPKGLENTPYATWDSPVEQATLSNVMAEDGGEPPMEKYVRFKRNPELVHKEMKKYGLTAREEEALNRYVGKSYGIGISQEQLMRTLMDSDICDFSLKEANKARKTVSKFC